MKIVDPFFLFKVLSFVIYFTLASQGGFYILSFYKVLQNLPTESFIEIRKATDNVIAMPLKILYPSGLAFILIWLVLADKSSGILGYGFLAASFILLATDLTLAVNVNIPLNKIIQHMTVDNGGEAAWVQQKWLKFILIRGCLSVTGYFSLTLHLLIQADRSYTFH
ncbi:hypothetical protein L0657_12580 [Dyadobacter sp. CY345]|uniref:hypothetical protein n=1 Tax=Dyadobacter sp. CY345 TaxID=2909335 RepID=UPI001F2A9E2B|nr:hypothetical protein [Dyadobacter sp. CY345]MCF2444796.1 hypothetical protein [Dyadobacter sp. CY345]